MHMPSPARVHTIKLKGPWAVRWIPDVAVAEAAESQTIHLPADCRTLFGDVAGTAVFERRFNRPTGLSPGHHVRIRFRDASGLRGVRVNESPQPLQQASDGSQFVDVADCLAPHNRLCVEYRYDPPSDPDTPAGLWQPVVLEIEEPDAAR